MSRNAVILAGAAVTLAAFAFVMVDSPQNDRSAHAAQAAWPCSAPRTLPPWARRTGSPERLAAFHAVMARNALHQHMYLRPADRPYTFELVASQQGVGSNASPPPIRRDSIRFLFTDAQMRAANSHVHLLKTVPLPLYTPNPCNPIGEFKAGVAIDTRGLSPGMYTLSADATVDPFTLPDGDPVAGARATLSDWSIYLPPQPAATPAMRVGQRFLVLPDATTVYTGDRGSEISRREITMHVAVLSRMDGKKLTLRVSGSPRVIVADAGNAPTQLPGLPPLVDDGVVRGLNRRYDGQRVWGRGGLGAQCVLDAAGGTWSGGGPNSRPYTVKHVFRIYRSSYDLAIGGQIGAIGGGRQSEFQDDSPLVVWLDVPADVTYSTISGTGGMSVRAQRSGVQTPPPQTPAPKMPVHLGPNDACVAYFSYFADAWDMDRAYSLSPPPPGIGTTVKTGMTHEQVAWVLGYPAGYGSPAQLDRIQAWRYDNLPPFSYWVYFDTSGHVTKFGPDGQLP